MLGESDKLLMARPVVRRLLVPFPLTVEARIQFPIGSFLGRKRSACGDVRSQIRSPRRCVWGDRTKKKAFCPGMFCRTVFCRTVFCRTMFCRAVLYPAMRPEAVCLRNLQRERVQSPAVRSPEPPPPDLSFLTKATPAVTSRAFFPSTENSFAACSELLHSHPGWTASAHTAPRKHSAMLAYAGSRALWSAAIAIRDLMFSFPTCQRNVYTHSCTEKPRTSSTFHRKLHSSQTIGPTLNELQPRPTPVASWQFRFRRAALRSPSLQPFYLPDSTHREHSSSAAMSFQACNSLRKASLLINSCSVGPT